MNSVDNGQGGDSSGCPDRSRKTSAQLRQLPHTNFTEVPPQTSWIRLAKT